MKVVVVSGVPGTGKTTLSKKLAEKLNFYYLDVNAFVTKNRLYEGYDRKRKTKIVDINKLNKALVKEIASINKAASIKTNFNKHDPIQKLIKTSIKNKKYGKNIENEKIKKGIIIDSHLSHYLPSKYVDLCIATKCGLKELKKRLKNKGYDENKIRENLDAEVFDICLNEAKESGHKVIVIDTTKGININAISKEIGGLIDI